VTVRVVRISIFIDIVTVTIIIERNQTAISLFLFSRIAVFPTPCLKTAKTDKR